MMCGEKSKTAASTIGDLYNRTSILIIKSNKLYDVITNIARYIRKFVLDVKMENANENIFYNLKEIL